MNVAFILSMALACYGGVEVWLNWQDSAFSTTRIWCEAWLCPQEFTSARIDQLMQKSLAGGEREALREFRRAVVLDSASAYEWADLGEAEMNARDLNAANYCFREAVKAGGSSPIILFRAANFEFQAGDQVAAMIHLRAILQDPELAAYYEPAFLTLSRMDLPIQRILDDGIPKNAVAADAFLRYLMEGRKIAESEAAWRRIEQYGEANDRLAGEYVSFLIREKEPAEAAVAWQRYSVEEPGYRKTNWVFNGGFEREPKPSLLDWTLESTKEVPVTRVAKAGHDGGWALQIKFSGDENVDFKQVRQTTVLGPGLWWLRAWVRTEGITTDRGVVLHVFDPQNGRRLDVWSDEMTGTNGWTLVSKRFEVGAETKAVMIEFAREASRKFDSKISGTAWLDSVELSPVLTRVGTLHGPRNDSE